MASFFLVKCGPGQTSCLFGDILNLVPEDIKRRIDQQEVECIGISAEDVQKAFRNKTVDEFFTKAGRLKCKLGDARRDFSLLCLAHPRHVKVVPAVGELRLSDEKFTKAKCALEAGGLA